MRDHPTHSTLTFLEKLMTKVLKCGDLIPGCSFEARGNSEEEVMAQAAEHAKSAHGLGEISEDMEMQVRGAIREEAEGKEQAEEIVVVESADEVTPAEATTEAVSKEQPLEVSQAEGETNVEEPAEPTLSEVLAVVESAEEHPEKDDEGERAQAAGA